MKSLLIILLNYSVNIFLNIYIDFNINKLVIYSDSVGSLIALDMIKYAIKNNIKTPDAAVFVFPCPKLILDETSFTKDPFVFLEAEEMSVYTKIQEQFLDFEKKEISEYREEDRLNFFLTDSNIVKQFPKICLLSAANEPIRENCFNFYEFLMYT
jgi:hypothetical protein